MKLSLSCPLHCHWSCPSSLFPVLILVPVPLSLIPCPCVSYPLSLTLSLIPVPCSCPLSLFPIPYPFPYPCVPYPVPYPCHCPCSLFPSLFPVPYPCPSSNQFVFPSPLGWQFRHTQNSLQCLQGCAPWGNDPGWLFRDVLHTRLLPFGHEQGEHLRE